jgi:hypothetical protein
MLEVTIYLKSGQSFIIMLEKLSIKYDGFGNLTSLDWKGAKNTLPHPMFLKLEDVSAILACEREVNL